MRSQSVSILEGNNFVVSDLRGDIDASPTEPQGLFSWDTRYLSRWQLRVDGKPLDPLSTDDLQYFSTQFFLVPATGSIYTNATMAVARKRSVGDGFHEDITISNYGTEAITLKVRLDAASDFADLFEVKDALPKKGEPYQRVEDGHLVLGYRREHFVRETWITATATEAELDTAGISFAVEVGPHAEWTTCVEVVTARTLGNRPIAHSKYGHGDQHGKLALDVSFQDLMATAPRLTSNWDDLERTYRRSVVDLAALRFFPRVLPGKAIVAAGLPWFMTIFGRDSLIVGLQTLPFAPGFAEAALRILAARQGTRVDPFRDEEPGKILHEQRFGELTAFEERPHSPYYGAADATPLFLVLLDEYERWTADRDLVQELEPAARRALEWIDDYGDRDHDGYVEYERRQETGLENQCWKDSWDSIAFADGSLAKLPRATCEIQGYVYDAKVRCARLARQVWDDPALAEKLEKEAAELKRRFNTDYWLADRQHFALALDGDKRPVDSLTSNIGHLLWSGIVDDDKAELVVQQLFSERLFSGWGIRTMAVGDGRFNPIGYHVGTVWPHDTAFIALGLRRYGHRAEATRLALGILEAASYFEGRLPEAFAGHARTDVDFPVEYPTACSPQAWATGAPLMLLRAMLGLEPAGRSLQSDPELPERITRLELRGMPWRGRRVDVVAGTGASAEANGHRPESLADRPKLEQVATARQLFTTLDRRVDRTELAGLRSSCRFDVDGAGSWRVLIVNGSVEVTESQDPADAVIKLPETLLLQLLAGSQNLITAVLSGRIEVDGDLAIGERVARALFRA
ncbi:MAG: SCP2 sterol-binding domain-containing protein [Chloroflexi bacterium]|nr:SCP2 sterol-binding domain-containing protein [Chloroflexota bacterium]